MQECEAGFITVRQDQDRLAFAAPPFGAAAPSTRPTSRGSRRLWAWNARRVRGHTWADNGPGWRVLELESAEQVLSAGSRPGVDGGREARCGGPAPRSGRREHPARRRRPLYEVRAFTLAGVEDPVTGSLNAGIAQWMVARGGMPAHWVATQGTALGRDGLIVVERIEQDGTIWIGGSTFLTVDGRILA